MDDMPHREAGVTALIGRIAWVRSCGAIMDDDRRYLMLRADVLMGIFHELPLEVRHAALEAFATSVRKHGGQSARVYFDAGGARPERLLEAIIAYSPELGWGHWHIDARCDEAIEVTVENSPFAEGFGHSPDPVCHAIVGMLQAVGPMIFGQPVVVSETGCAAQAGIDRCSFRVVRTAASAHPLASATTEREGP